MVAAQVLGIPYLAMFPMPGPGVLVRPDSVIASWDTSEVTRQAREEILAAYEVDILERGGLMEFYSAHGNLCTTVGPLFVPLASAMQKQRFDGFPWHCVGPLLPKEQKSRVAHPLAKADELPVEALSLGIPLAVVPMFGDQPINAEKVANIGAAVSFREPLKTLTPESLRRAVSQLLEEDSPFRSAAQGLQRQMASAPGVKGAVDIILDVGKGARPSPRACLSTGLGGA
ncbi:unnamed protein product [Effrenium voratum]|nr:unnamed protein product [Effrenium voratum]